MMMPQRSAVCWEGAGTNDSSPNLLLPSLQSPCELSRRRCQHPDSPARPQLPSLPQPPPSLTHPSPCCLPPCTSFYETASPSSLDTTIISERHRLAVHLLPKLPFTSRNARSTDMDHECG